MLNSSKTPPLSLLHYFSALAPVLCCFWTNSSPVPLWITPLYGTAVQSGCKQRGGEPCPHHRCALPLVEIMLLLYWGQREIWSIFNWRKHLPKVTFRSVICQWKICWWVLSADWQIRRIGMWNAGISATSDQLDAGFQVIYHRFLKFCIPS